MHNICCNFFVMYHFQSSKFWPFSPKNNKKMKHTQILSSSISHTWSKSNEKLQHWAGEEYIATKILLNFQWEEDIPRNYELFEIVHCLKWGHFDYHNTLSASAQIISFRNAKIFRKYFSLKKLFIFCAGKWTNYLLKYCEIFCFSKNKIFKIY